MPPTPPVGKSKGLSDGVKEGSKVGFGVGERLGEPEYSGIYGSCQRHMVPAIMLCCYNIAGVNHDIPEFLITC